MKILITNDDGIKAEGIKLLVAELAQHHEIYVVAPDREYTGYGGAVTFNNKIEVAEYPLNRGEIASYKVNGTPADCVILGLDELSSEVDLVISGINNEPNLGDDTRLSGTLGACREAAFSSIPAIGFSLNYDYGNTFYYQTVVRVVIILIKQIERNKLPEGIYLNINVPNKPISQIKGFKVVKLGRRRYNNRVHLVKNEGKSYYKIYGTIIEEEQEETDVWAIKNDYVSVTPLNRDNTDYNSIKLLKSWNLGL